ncbi:MAG TPA: plasmid pRiA4b ORF-3 family protein, partial [Bradyrhizobium sp.]|nr:plasmid pRiA4b ORF-3 family protein [Bradyrhizobium sp.]
MSADDIAILRVELIDIEPLIWRRVAVPTATNLQTLHRIIQAVMGWQDYHLWEFTADEEVYGTPEPDDAMWDRKVRRASTTKLAS